MSCTKPGRPVLPIPVSVGRSPVPVLVDERANPLRVRRRCLKLTEVTGVCNCTGLHVLVNRREPVGIRDVESIILPVQESDCDSPRWGQSIDRRLLWCSVSGRRQSTAARVESGDECPQPEQEDDEIEQAADEGNLVQDNTEHQPDQ